MGIEQEALDFTVQLMGLYFEYRDMDGILSRIGEHITWIGTGVDEFVRGCDQAAAALQGEVAEYGGAFRVEDPHFFATPISDDACVVCGNLRTVPTQAEVEVQHLRFSLVYVRQDNSLRLIHIHFSLPDCVQSTGHYYVQNAERRDNDALRGALMSREQQLEDMVRNVPGGVHQCRNDGCFTFLDISDGFLRLFGYSRAEIQQRFEDKFINMLHPADRAEILRIAREQLRRSDGVELEYRVPCKDGRTLWILDQGRLLHKGTEDECFYCILIDITARKKEQEALRLSLERHQVIMDQATDIIFEWDIQADILSFSPNWRKKFGYSPISSAISQRISYSQNIYPDDIPAFVNIIHDTAAGTPYSETEVRIRKVSGRYIWCRIRATVQYDGEGHPIKAVGVILDVDAEHKQRQMLIDQAQRDALTGLYNKTAVSTLVEQRMDSGVGNQALMMIDIDNFKAVNDTYGHFAGDSVLSNVAAALKRSFRSSDLVGRIGGDEFLVYLSEVEDAVAATAKAQRLLERLETISPARGAPHITCSVGVAVFPRGGVDYFAFYKCADLALYYRKDNGRSGVTIYNPSLCERMPCGLAPTAVSTPIGSGESSVADEQIPQYAFRILSGTADTAVALAQLLEIIGRAYDVSRVYFFESSKDGTHVSVTFEWCNIDVSPQMPLLQNLSYREDLSNYQNNFDSDGTFYCSDVNVLPPTLRAILSPQGIQSMFQCAIFEDGHFWGGVGFDECRENRAWSTLLIDSFKITASVLSCFLVKLRLKESLQRLTQEIEERNSKDASV